MVTTLHGYEVTSIRSAGQANFLSCIASAVRCLQTTSMLMESLLIAGVWKMCSVFIQRSSNHTRKSRLVGTLHGSTSCTGRDLVHEGGIELKRASRAERTGGLSSCGGRLAAEW